MRLRAEQNQRCRKEHGSGNRVCQFGVYSSVDFTKQGWLPVHRVETTSTFTTMSLLRTSPGL